jgi:hypothetical protein
MMCAPCIKHCTHFILNIYAAARGGLENKMKLKKGFVLRELAGECVVVSTNSELNLNGIITLNSTAKTIWLAPTALRSSWLPASCRKLL